MVEFALVVSLVFLPMVFGIIEFGRFIWTKTMITAAAREGVRYAIVHWTRAGLEQASSERMAVHHSWARGR